MQTIESKLEELGYKLPGKVVPAGNYLPTRRVGNLLFISGVLPVLDGKLSHIGAVGAEQTIEAAQEAARICVLNALAAIRDAAGSLEKVRQFVLVNGFVFGVHGFSDSPAVINGASDLLVELFGDVGRHARAAVAVAGLPKSATVELQIQVELADF